MSIKRLNIIILIIILNTILFSSNVIAAGDFDVYHNFSSNPAEQGEYVTITITITNSNPDQCRIYWLGIHFDWQAENIYSVCSDVSEGDPESLATDETKSFRIYIEIPSNVLTSYHSYDIRFDYELHDGWFGEWNDYTWKSETQTDFRVIEKKGTSNNGGSGDSSSDTSSGIIGGIELLIILGVIILIIVIGLIAWAISRKKKSQQYYQPQQYPPQQHYPQRSKQQYEDDYKHPSSPHTEYPQFPPTRKISTPPPQQYQTEYPSKSRRREEQVRWEDEEKPKIPKFCPECGVLTEGKRFCSQCGKKLI